MKPQEKSCHYCGNLLTTGKRAIFWCDKGGLGGEVFEPNGKGTLTLWQKIELYKRQRIDTKLSLLLRESAEQCKDYDGEA